MKRAQETNMMVRHTMLPPVTRRPEAILNLTLRPNQCPPHPWSPTAPVMRHHRSESSRIAQRFRWVSWFCKRVAKSPSLFSAWMDGAKIVEILIPPVEVTDHFDRLHQLAEVPSTLVRVSIPYPHIYHS